MREGIGLHHEANSPIIRFGPFEANLEAGELRKGGTRIRLQDQPFQILILLLDSPGGIVTREEIAARLWKGATFVDLDQSIGAAVNKLRRALGDSATTPRYIETLRQKGFRLLVPVQRVETPIPPPVTRVRQPWWRHPLVTASLLAALATVGLAAWIGSRSVAGPIRTLAILPFSVIGAAGTGDHLELGIPDALITRLGRLQNVAVRPIGSVRRWAGHPIDPLEAGRIMGVDAVLEGTIQMADGRIRVSARLLRMPNGVSLWTGQFDESAAGVLGIQDAITERVAGSIAARLSPSESADLKRSHTSNPDAFFAYQKGRYLWSLRSADALERSIGYFQQAIGLDSRYALAYAGLADVYCLLNFYSGTNRKGLFEHARSAVDKALEIDPTLGEALTTDAFLRFYHEWDWHGAERAFALAIRRSPNYSTARQWFAEYLFYSGRFDEASREIQRAHQLDPQSPLINLQLASPDFFAGRFERSIPQVREGLRLEPDSLVGQYMLGTCFLELGRFDEAIAQFERIRSTNLGLAALGSAYARSGRRDDAVRILRQMLELARLDRISAYHLARIYASLGDPDPAFEWLSKAVNDRDERIVMLQVDSYLNPIRQDRRFQELSTRVGLARP
jgi:TolB-like protein/DNA-binding winged helix-turn-helix (wHTH) protein/tetratricopeptide (TPR) repeat protein